MRRIISEDIEAVKKYYPSIEDSKFMELIALDPTYREGSKSLGKYGKWILNLYKNGSITDADLEEVTPLLQQFTNYRARIENKDLQAYKTLDELSAVLAAVVEDNSMLTDRQKLRFARKLKKGKIVVAAEDKHKTVFENDNYIIQVPLTHEASMKLGDGTSWCTANRNKDWYDTYTKGKGKLYIIKNKKTGDRWQYSDLKNVILDQNDRKFDLMQLLTSDKELNKFLNNLNPGMFPDVTAFQADGSYLYTGGQIVDEDFKKRLKKIIIADSVTELPRRAFMGCKYLKEVVIPDTVLTIGGSAFRECYRLESINIPSSVTSIGVTAFFDCVQLKGIKLPDSVTSLGAYAFGGCETMKEAVLSSGIKIIPEQAFCGCAELERVTIPDGIEVIGKAAFGSCYALKSVRIPNSVKVLQDGAFGRCKSLTSAKIGTGVESISSTTFSNCKELVVYTNSDYVKQFCADNNIKYSQDLRGANESMKLRIKEDTACVPSKTSYIDVTKNKNGIYYFGKKPNAPKSWRDECGVKKQTKLSIKESEDIIESEELDEVAITASIGNVMNQVMNIVHDAFEFFGGSFVPEFLMKSKDEPEVEIKVKGNGRNVEIIPQYNHIPDYLNIKKGISISNAPRAIADTAIDAVEHYKEVKK